MTIVEIVVAAVAFSGDAWVVAGLPLLGCSCFIAGNLACAQSCIELLLMMIGRVWLLLQVQLRSVRHMAKKPIVFV